MSSKQIKFFKKKPAIVWIKEQTVKRDFKLTREWKI